MRDLEPRDNISYQDDRGMTENFFLLILFSTVRILCYSICNFKTISSNVTNFCSYDPHLLDSCYKLLGFMFFLFSSRNSLNFLIMSPESISRIWPTSVSQIWLNLNLQVVLYVYLLDHHHQIHSSSHQYFCHDFVLPLAETSNATYYDFASIKWFDLTYLSLLVFIIKL